MQQFWTLGKCKGNERQEKSQTCKLSLNSTSSATAADRMLSQMGHWYNSVGSFSWDAHFKKGSLVCKSNCIATTSSLCVHMKNTSYYHFSFLIQPQQLQFFQAILYIQVPKSLISLTADLYIIVFIILNFSPRNGCISPAKTLIAQWNRKMHLTGSITVYACMCFPSSQQ